MKATTALIKISRLKKRIWGIQGGQGAGKTWAILELIINHCLKNPNKEVFIASDELSKMRITIIKDFIKIMKSFCIFNKSEFTDGTLYRFANGSFIKFIGLDKADIGKGLRSDIIYINECNKVNFETYRELTSRAKRIIVDFNPNNKFWFHDEVMNRPDCDYINLTFKDNEFLSEEERNEILLYYEKGYNQDGTIKNEYWANMWRVYGLGEIGKLKGAILNNWTIGKFDTSLPFICGLDFGSKDPDALIKVAVDHKEKLIYVDELIYKSNNSTDDLIKLVGAKVDKRTLIIADSASPRTIDDIKGNGYNIHKVDKPKIIDSVKVLQGYRIIVTENSINIIRELNDWVWLDKKGEIPADCNNHSIDAIRYAVTMLVKPPTNFKGIRVLKRN